MDCNNCKGEGFVVRGYYRGDTMWMDCPDCGGTGFDSEFVDAVSDAIRRGSQRPSCNLEAEQIEAATAAVCVTVKVWAEQGDD